MAQLILLHYLSHLLIQAIQYITLFFIALWRNNSHTIHLSIQSVQFMILVYLQRCAASPQSNFRICLSPLKEIPYPLAVILHSSFWQPLVHSLSLWICLFWTFHISGITLCDLFDWLPSPSTVSSRIILTAACINTSLPFIDESIVCMYNPSTVWTYCIFFNLVIN